MKILNLFPTAIIKEHISFGDKELDFIRSRKFLRVINDNGFISNSTNLLDYEELNKLRSEIQTRLEKIFYEIYCFKDNQKIYITTSWANVHKKNDYAQQHRHANSFLSGILFCKIPEKSGNINFFNPYANFGSALEFNIKNKNPFNSNSISFVPEEGALYIFPSSLQHSVDRSESDQDRLTLAFNTFVKGTLGLHETSLDL